MKDLTNGVFCIKIHEAQSCCRWSQEPNYISCVNYLFKDLLVQLQQLCCELQ